MFGMYVCEVCEHVASVRAAANVHSQETHGISADFADMYWYRVSDDTEAATLLRKAEDNYRANPNGDTSAARIIARRGYYATV